MTPRGDVEQNLPEGQAPDDHPDWWPDEWAEPIIVPKEMPS